MPIYPIMVNVAVLFPRCLDFVSLVFFLISSQITTPSDDDNDSDSDSDSDDDRTSPHDTGRAAEQSSPSPPDLFERSSTSRLTPPLHRHTPWRLGSISASVTFSTLDTIPI